MKKLKNKYGKRKHLKELKRKKKREAIINYYKDTGVSWEVTKEWKKAHSKNKPLKIA